MLDFDSDEEVVDALLNHANNCIPIKFLSGLGEIVAAAKRMREAIAAKENEGLYPCKVCGCYIGTPPLCGACASMEWN